MTNQKNINKVMNQYRKTFGEHLQHPPLDYGFFTEGQIASIARKALQKGQPVRDWGEYLEPLPDDCIG